MKLLEGFFDGTRGLSIWLTGEQAASVSHQGDCLADCIALAENPEVAKQLAALSPEAIRTALKEAGFEDADIADETQNRLRALWLAAWDIVENRRSI